MTSPLPLQSKKLDHSPRQEGFKSFNKYLLLKLFPFRGVIGFLKPQERRLHIFMQQCDSIVNFLLTERREGERRGKGGKGGRGRRGRGRGRERDRGRGGGNF
tara:strand:+ start:331 stop:636 length:306 start_codon:yes stop_codon:yes gene_type:complete